MAVVGVLHPGQMGVSVAASALVAGNDVLWVAEGRSAQTIDQATAAGLRDLGTLQALSDAADLIISVAPPSSAVDVAHAVAETGFGGLYLDANAVSPETAQAIADIVTRSGATPIDGGIIGLPAWNAGTTRMYVAGVEAASVADMLNGGPLDVIALDSNYGSASALKMAYAGWTKGSAALLLTIAAYAESAGVSDALAAEWDLSQPGLAQRAKATATGVGPKAWRFAGEMDEIAATLDNAGLPTGYHAGAADTYRRMAPFKDPESDVTLGDVIASLLADPNG